jgi:hypothetical protein
MVKQLMINNKHHHVTLHVIYILFIYNLLEIIVDLLEYYAYFNVCKYIIL